MSNNLETLRNENNAIKKESFALSSCSPPAVNSNAPKTWTLGEDVPQVPTLNQPVKVPWLSNKASDDERYMAACAILSLKRYSGAKLSQDGRSLILDHRGYQRWRDKHMLQHWQCSSGVNPESWFRSPVNIGNTLSFTPIDKAYTAAEWVIEKNPGPPLQLNPVSNPPAKTFWQDLEALMGQYRTFQVVLVFMCAARWIVMWWMLILSIYHVCPDFDSFLSFAIISVVVILFLMHNNVAPLIVLLFSKNAFLAWSALKLMMNTPRVQMICSIVCVIEHIYTYKTSGELNHPSIVLLVATFIICQSNFFMSYYIILGLKNMAIDLWRVVALHSWKKWFHLQSSNPNNAVLGVGPANINQLPIQQGLQFQWVTLVVNFILKVLNYLGIAADFTRVTLYYVCDVDSVPEKELDCQYVVLPHSDPCVDFVEKFSVSVGGRYIDHVFGAEEIAKIIEYRWVVLQDTRGTVKLYNIKPGAGHIPGEWRKLAERHNSGVGYNQFRNMLRGESYNIVASDTFPLNGGTKVVSTKHAYNKWLHSSLNGRSPVSDQDGYYYYKAGGDWLFSWSQSVESTYFVLPPSHMVPNPALKDRWISVYCPDFPKVMKFGSLHNCAVEFAKDPKQFEWYWADTPSVAPAVFDKSLVRDSGKGIVIRSTPYTVENYSVPEDSVMIKDDTATGDAFTFGRAELISPSINIINSPQEDNDVIDDSEMDAGSQGQESVKREFSLLFWSFVCAFSWSSLIMYIYHVFHYFTLNIDFVYKKLSITRYPRLSSWIRRSQFPGLGLGNRLWSSIQATHFYQPTFDWLMPLSLITAAYSTYKIFMPEQAPEVIPSGRKFVRANVKLEGKHQQKGGMKIAHEDAKYERWADVPFDDFPDEEDHFDESKYQEKDEYNVYDSEAAVTVTFERGGISYDVHGYQAKNGNLNITKVKALRLNDGKDISVSPKVALTEWSKAIKPQVAKGHVAMRDSVKVSMPKKFISKGSYFEDPKAKAFGNDGVKSQDFRSLNAIVDQPKGFGANTYRVRLIGPPSAPEVSQYWIASYGDSVASLNKPSKPIWVIQRPWAKADFSNIGGKGLGLQDLPSRVPEGGAKRQRNAVPLNNVVIRDIKSKQIKIVKAAASKSEGAEVKVPKKMVVVLTAKHLPPKLLAGLQSLVANRPSVATPTDDEKPRQQGRVINHDRTPIDSVFHIQGPRLSAHASFIKFRGLVCVQAPQHVIELESDDMRPIVCTYFAGTTTIQATFIFKCFMRHRDVCYCEIFSKSYRPVSPFVPPLPVRFIRRYRGVVCAELLGCNVCQAVSQTDMVDLGTCKYKVNTFDGDCGRPVIFYDRYVGADGVFYYVGSHHLYYPAEKINGFCPALPPQEEAIEYIADIPGGAMNPSSEFIYDSVAEPYFTDLIDISAYEIKTINKDIASRMVNKYDRDYSWRFDDHEVEEAVFKLLEIEHEAQLKELGKPLLDVDDFVQACMRQGDGSLSHTSCGFPLSREFRDKVEAMSVLGPELYDMILDGSINDIPSVFSLFLKDEVRAKAKDVRAILSAPLHHLAVCVFLFYRFHIKGMERCADKKSLSSLGIDTQKDLGFLYKSLFPRDFGGSYDIDGMDTSTSRYHFGRYTAIWRRYVHSDYLKQFDKVVTEAVFTPMRLADGSLWIKDGGNPTGWYLTGDLNTWDSEFKFYYAVGCWVKNNRPDEWARNPVHAMRSRFYSKHNGDDTIFGFTTDDWISKREFIQAWNGKISVTWDDPESDFSPMHKTTFLSMAPVALEDRWRDPIPNHIPLTHCKLARPLTKMFYRKKYQSYTVLYNKTVSLLTLCWFSKKWSTILMDIKNRLEERFGDKITYFPNSYIPLIKGEVIQEQSPVTPPWTSYSEPVSPLSWQQGRRSPKESMNNLAIVPKNSGAVVPYKQPKQNKPKKSKKQTQQVKQVVKVVQQPRIPNDVIQSALKPVGSLVHNIMSQDEAYVLPRPISTVVAPHQFSGNKALEPDIVDGRTKGAMIIRPNPDCLIEYTDPEEDQVIASFRPSQDVNYSFTYSDQIMCIDQTFLLPEGALKCSTCTQGVQASHFSNSSKSLKNGLKFYPGTWTIPNAAWTFRIYNPYSHNLSFVPMCGTVGQDGIAVTDWTGVSGNINSKSSSTITVAMGSFGTFITNALAGKGIWFGIQAVAGPQAFPSNLSFSVEILNVTLTTPVVWRRVTLWDLLPPGFVSSETQYRSASRTCVTGLHFLFQNVTLHMGLGGSMYAARLPGDTYNLPGTVDGLIELISSQTHHKLRQNKLEHGLSWSYTPEKIQDWLFQEPVAADPYNGNPYNLPFLALAYSYSGLDATQHLSINMAVTMSMEYLTVDPSNTFWKPQTFPGYFEALVMELSKCDVLTENPAHLRNIANMTKKALTSDTFKLLATNAIKAGVKFAPLVLSMLA